MSAAAAIMGRPGLQPGQAAGLRPQHRRAGVAIPLRQRVQRASVARRRRVEVEARYASTPDVADRILSAVPYLLPFLDAFSYGRYLFYQFPVIKSMVMPFAPLLNLYATVPFAGLICFFAIYLGIVNNMQWRRYVRFNAMQAVLLDILLVLPRLLESLAAPPTSGWGLQAYIISQNTIWIFVAASVAYCVFSCVIGQAGRIPFVGDAADQQVPQ